MARIRVCIDRRGNTLTVWFGNMEKEHICEEVDDEVILMKDWRGRILGFERLNFLNKKQQAYQENVPVEVQLL